METLLLVLFLGGFVCTAVCLCQEQVGWVQKSTGHTGRTVSAAAYWVLCIHYASFSLTSLLGSLAAVRITLLGHRSGKNMLVVWHPVTLHMLMAFIHINTTRCVQHAGWPRPCCMTRAIYGYFLRADRALFSLSVMNYHSLGRLSYSFKKGMLMSCTSWKTHY